MLVLSRKLNQSIMIGDDVEIIIVSVDRDQVKIGIKAPREIAVHRSEVYLEIQRANEAAASAAVDAHDVGTANPAVLHSASAGKPQKKGEEQKKESEESDKEE
jgi:carbon storage regulator